MRSDTVCELVQNSQETQQSHTVYNCATLQKANIIFSCIASHMNFSSIARGCQVSAPAKHLLFIGG